MKVDLQTICEELNKLDPTTDTEYFDNENLRIDICISEAQGYLERRRDDPPSTAPLTESWVCQHAVENENVYVSETGLDEVDVVSSQFAAMSTV